MPEERRLQRNIRRDVARVTVHGDREGAGSEQLVGYAIVAEIFDARTQCQTHTCIGRDPRLIRCIGHCFVDHFVIIRPRCLASRQRQYDGAVEYVHQFQCIDTRRFREEFHLCGNNARHFTAARERDVGERIGRLSDEQEVAHGG